MAENEQHTENPNIHGISRAITDIGFSKLIEGAHEEVQAYAVIAQWLAALGEAIADEEWDIVKGLADGDISSDDAARHFGWL